ncbi:MAG: hypothetical protein CFE44_13115 [Burkholderiales bacterium PBB4]|nr:MAG: hypothetical protein CFE44_13115 [Burkholderiales bacterium PBB4]
MTDLITIAIPCYNRIEYFHDAIKGALNQTVPCRVLVVDNASPTDDYERACGALANPRIRYVRNEANIGMFGNWNRCIELSETPYVHILGDDDLVSIRYVECFLKALKEDPELDLFFSAVRHTGSSEKMFCENDGRKVPYGWFHCEDLRWWAGFRGLKMPSISTAFRTSLFKSGGFNVKRHSANDYEFLYTLNGRHLLYGSTEELYTYRIHATADTAKNYGVAFCNYPFIYHRAAELARTDHPGVIGWFLSGLLRMQADVAMRWWAQTHWTVARSMIHGEMHGYDDLVGLIERSYPDVFRRLTDEDGPVNTSFGFKFNAMLLQGIGFLFSCLQRLRIRGTGAP